jgi:twinkle protein
MADIQDFLAAEKIRLRTCTAGTYKTTCPACSHTRKKRSDPCLSVTIRSDDDVTFNCHHCGHSGGSPRHRDDSRPQNPRRAYRRPAPVSNPERPERLISWFGARGIGPDAVNAAGIYRTRFYFPQGSAEADCIAFPYVWKGVLRNVKYRSADKHFAQEKDAEPVLYNADSIALGADLLFVEGEIDVISMQEVGFCSVVSLPNGAPHKVETSDKRYAPLETHADELEHAGRILIATDMDEPGQLLANELARRLGKDRCWRVSFPEGCKDANDTLQRHGPSLLQQCVTDASPWPIDGLYDVGSFLDDVLMTYRGQGPQPLSTGFPEFDKAFRVIPGQFVVITGIPNHGKSRFLDQVAVQMSRLHGWSWGVFSPETGSAQHIADLCEIVAERPFHSGPSDRMSEGDLQSALAWTRSHVCFIDSREHTPTLDWVLEKARAAVLRHGIQGLIIDPYNELEAGRPPQMTETEFVSQLISKCKRFAKVHDVTVFMVAHPTKLNGNFGRRDDDGKEPMPGLYDIAGSAHWRNKADAGLVVYRDFEGGRTIVASKKIRRQPICGHPGAVVFSFLGSQRIFAEIPGSYQPEGRKVGKFAA